MILIGRFLSAELCRSLVKLTSKVGQLNDFIYLFMLVFFGAQVCRSLMRLTSKAG